MATSESAMGRLISDFQADHLISSDNYPLAAKIASAMAMYGMVCVTKQLYKNSKSLAKYCFHATPPLTSVTLTSRYGGHTQDSPEADQGWAMILNSADQLGNAYAQQLAALGFHLILSGPPIDEERMQGQASIIQQQHNVRTFVLLIDYQQNIEQYYQEIGQTLAEYDICILVNNQTYTVPFEMARVDLLSQSIEACVAQINKHIYCSLLIQQLVVPKMLTRHERRQEVRSAILTLKTHANALFEQQIGQTFKFPILRSAMAFNAGLSRAQHDSYTNKGIDVMQAFTPYVAFESWLKHGLILEALMQERMLAGHVRSILNHLRQGYAESNGSWENALVMNGDGNQMLRMQLMATQPLIQGRFFERYAEMAEERRLQDIFQLDQLKANDEEEIKSISTTDIPTKEVEVQVEQCNAFIKESIIQSYREMAEDQQIESEYYEEVEISMDQITIVDEDEFIFEPQEGDKLNFYNERRVNQAAMSSNTKASLLAESIQTPDYLIRQMTNAKEQKMVMSELQFDSMEADEIPDPVDGDSMEIYNEKIVQVAQRSGNKNQMLKAQADSSEKRNMMIEEQAEIAKITVEEEAQKVVKQLRVAKEIEDARLKAEAESIAAEKERIAAEEEAAREAVEKARIAAAKEAQRVADAAEQVRVAKEIEDARQKAEIEKERIAAEEETARIEAEEARIAAEEEAAREAAEQARVAKEIEDARLKAEAESIAVEKERIAAEEEAKRIRVEEEAARIRVEEEAARIRVEEEEAARIRVEEEEATRIRVEEEAARIRVEEEAARIAAEEETKRIAAEEKAAKEANQQARIAKEIEDARMKAEAEKVTDSEPVPDKEAQTEEPVMLATEEVKNVASLEIETENEETTQPGLVKVTSPSSKTLKTTTSPAMTPQAVNTSASEEDKSLINQNSKLATMSVAPSEETNDTNTISEKGDEATKNQVLGPRPYNRMSQDRAQSQNSSNNTSKTEEETQEANEETKEANEETKEQDVTAERINPFQPKVSLISSDQPSHISDRDNAQTPAFTDEKLQIPAVSSSTESKEQLSSDDRSKSPFMRVRLSPMVDPSSLKNLNRSRISDNSRGISSDGRGTEWKATQFKTLNISKVNSQVNNQKSFETHLAENRKSDLSQPKSLTDEQGVAITMQTLEENKEESSDSDINGSSSPDPMNDDLKACMTLSDRPDQNIFSDPMNLDTPRSDFSSTADMRELKMALGGMSDRSAEGLGDTNLVFKQKTDLIKENNVIFSDEGSNDSFNIENDEQESSALWAKPEIDKKASLQFMRSTTLRMSKGDECDQAIQKVLQNLVNNYLIGFDPNAVDNDPNLIEEQKLEKKNQNLIYELATCLPFVKIKQGVYLVGTEIRPIQIKGRGVLVRTGGGYMYLSEFLLHYAKSECLKLGLMILKQNKTFQAVVVGLIKRQANSLTVQKEFIKKCPKSMHDQFTSLVARVRVLETNLQKQRRQKEPMKNKSMTSPQNLNLSMRSSDSGQRREPMYIQNVKNQKTSSSNNLSPTLKRSSLNTSYNVASPQKSGSSGRLSATMPRSNASPNNSPNLGTSGYATGRQTMPRSTAELTNSGYKQGDPRNASGRKSAAANNSGNSLFTPVRSKHLKQNTGKKSPVIKKKKATNQNPPNIPVSDVDDQSPEQSGTRPSQQM